MSLFNEMPEAGQERYLKETLKELRNGSAVKKTKALAAAWSTANGRALEGLAREDLSEKTKTGAFVQRKLIDERNPQMVDKVEALLKSETASFVGVGFLHLVGENGLPALLRQRGYEVEKVY